jgi:hypothetical protein
MKQFLGNGHNSDVRVPAEPSVEFHKPGAQHGAAHGIANLQQDKTSSEPRGDDFTADGNGPFVELIVRIQRGQKEGRVGEDSCHRFGVPYR